MSAVNLNKNEMFRILYWAMHSGDTDETQRNIIRKLYKLTK